MIQSHFNEEPERFRTIALQLAASEARIGHSGVAFEIKTIIERGRKSEFGPKGLPPALQELILESHPIERLADLIVGTEVKEKIVRVLSEFVQRETLHKHDLKNRRKLLLTGPPGTGKTMTASILACELRMPLYTVLVDRIVSKYMGETGAKLRLVFEAITQHPGVYLFDEFDAIGAERGRTDDVAEMRRVLNSFLQFIERDDSQSLIIATTNNSYLLDQALFRRFDDVIRFELPTKEEKIQLLRNRLSGLGAKLNLTKILPSINGLSHAEIVAACLDARKMVILSRQEKLNEQLVIKTIRDRNAAYHTHHKH